MNPKLREQLAHNGRPHRVRCRFNLDRRLYKQRLLLSAAAIAGMILTAMLVGRWSVFLLPLVVSILICLVLSFYSYRMLKVRQPVIAIGRNGIWDRRLGGSVIPWTEILRVRTDRFGNIILDPWREFSGRAMSRRVRPITGDVSVRATSVTFNLPAPIGNRLMISSKLVFCSIRPATKRVVDKAVVMSSWRNISSLSGSFTSARVLGTRKRKEAN